VQTFKSHPSYGLSETSIRQLTRV